MLPDPNDRFMPRRRGGVLRKVTIAIALAAVTVFAGLIGYTYMNRGGSGAPGTAPLIKADPRPMKVAPDQPGGMQVPHQDKEIYGRMGREQAPQQTAKVERLLPPPETPMARPVPAEPPPAPPAAAAPQTQPPQPQPGAVEPPPPAPRAGAQPAAPPPIATPQPQTPPAAPPANVARATPPPPPPPAPAAKPAAPAAMAPAAIAPAAGGRYRIQLAAVRTNESAGREWEKMRRAHPDLLGPLSLNVVRADLGDRGTFYRIQAGPLPNESAAKELCRRLSEKKMGCLVVRP
jgi:hypothetical protein